MVDLANAQMGLPDTNRMLAVNDDAREPVAVAVEKRAVGAAQILGDELPGLVAKHAQMLRGDVGIVDDDVVVIAAADARLRSGDPETRGNIAVTRQYFHPDHLLVCTDCRKRLPSATASS